MTAKPSVVESATYSAIRAQRRLDSLREARYSDSSSARKRRVSLPARGISDAAGARSSCPRSDMAYCTGRERRGLAPTLHDQGARVDARLFCCSALIRVRQTSYAFHPSDASLSVGTNSSLAALAGRGNVVSASTLVFMI